MFLKKNKDKLWTPVFFILWQSQLVSILGDAAYSIALGFWVLEVTGSTGLMGALMAVSTLPGVLVSPFAGVLVDRYKRKKLLILMDMIRGLSVLIISIAAFNNKISVWEVFLAGIILSICGAVFRPCVNSSVPDVVPNSRLENANSMLAIVNTGANMVGNVAGGFLFQIVGAPFLFLFNGLSYFFSGISIFFISIPRVEKKSEQNFLKDMKDGFSFMWKLKGLRYILFMAAALNFFSYISMVLFLPLFQETPYLGAGKYGIAMACVMGGAMIGFLFLSAISIPPARRLKMFIISIVVYNSSLIIAVNQSFFAIMMIFLVLGGFFNSIVNVILISTAQAATPQEMRGKVMAFMSMTSEGLTPIAMALGGVLADFISIRIIMSASFVVIIAIVVPFIFIKSFKKFISYDYEKNSLTNLIQDQNLINEEA